MNIEASGFLSMFAGLDGLENIQQTLLQDGALPEQFAEALAQQLEVLRQAQVTSSQSEGVGQNEFLQDFTAFSGIKLPPVSKDVDIDLEATLQALAEVLKNIDEVGTGARLPELDSLGEETLVDPDSELVDADLSKVMEMAASQQTRVVPVTVPPAGDISASTAEVAAEMAEVLAPKILNPQRALEGNKSGLKSERVISEDAGVKGALSMAGLNEQDVVSELEALKSGKGDNQAFDQNKKPLLPEFSNAGVKAAQVDGDKPDLPKMAAEIAMLNRSVINEAKTEIPAMNRQVGHPQWGQELSEKLVWMHKQAVPAAELNLNPRNLGPVSIRVDVNQDQTTIAFSTQHAVVKDAIEAALPRLREMLASQQLNLVDVNVSQQQSEQKQANGFFQMNDQQNRNSRHSDMEDEQGQSLPNSVVDEIEAGRAIASNGILSIFA